MSDNPREEIEGDVAQVVENCSQFGIELFSHRVELHLPAFQIESTFSLNESLHKAFVDVNEKGTEAAAATAVAMAGRSASREPDPEVFHADHPFLFLIRDRATGLIHFMGRFAVPEGAS